MECCVNVDFRLGGYGLNIVWVFLLDQAETK